MGDVVSDAVSWSIVDVSDIVRVIKTLLVVGSAPHSKPSDSGFS